jgi:hypothetical protein
MQCYDCQNGVHVGVHDIKVDGAGKGVGVL